jgi:riboflavin kinase / FMN adenylyltransferase
MGMTAGLYTRLEDVESVPAGGRVVAIGVFDGVHLGHQSIVKEAVAAAEALGARPTVVTFYPHPEALLRPGSGPVTLTLPGRKAQLLWELGIVEVVTVDFDQQFAQLLPEAFCSVVLSTRLGARAVVVGDNFRFGRRGCGTADDLTAFGLTHGFSVCPVPLVSRAGEPISSTRIRCLLSAGEVAEAAGLLGRPHRLEGLVVRGAGRGTGLHYPTANLAVTPELALPAEGVYVTRATIDGNESYDSVTSVGTNPTFEKGGEVHVETVILEYKGDLYGHTLAVDFLERIRGQEVFDGASALVKRIEEDVLAARKVHDRMRTSG